MAFWASSLPQEFLLVDLLPNCMGSHTCWASQKIQKRVLAKHVICRWRRVSTHTQLTSSNHWLPASSPHWTPDLGQLAQKLLHVLHAHVLVMACNQSFLIHFKSAGAVALQCIHFAWDPSLFHFSLPWSPAYFRLGGWCEDRLVELLKSDQPGSNLGVRSRLEKPRQKAHTWMFLTTKFCPLMESGLHRSYDGCFAGVPGWLIALFQCEASIRLYGRVQFFALFYHSQWNEKTTHSWNWLVWAPNTCKRLECWRFLSQKGSPPLAALPRWSSLPTPLGASIHRTLGRPSHRQLPCFPTSILLSGSLRVLTLYTTTTLDQLAMTLPYYTRITFFLINVFTRAVHQCVSHHWFWWLQNQLMLSKLDIQAVWVEPSGDQGTYSQAISGVSNPFACIGSFANTRVSSSCLSLIFCAPFSFRCFTTYCFDLYLLWAANDYSVNRFGL